VRWSLLAAAAAASLLTLQSAIAADPLPPALIDAPAVKAALADADASLDQFVEEWITIAQTPAPSGQERRRADYIERRFRELGLQVLSRDPAGNVVGIIKGKNSSVKKVALVAHMDTVAGADADHSVKRLPNGGDSRLQAPGIRDDSSGLGALLAAAALLKRHGLRPAADTYIVASAQEEIGLKGAERFVEDHGADLGAFIAVDGQLGQISYAASGIVWLKLRFKAEGAHTLRSHEKPNAVLAAARAIERISAIPLRRSPEALESWLNIGSMGGGDVPNAAARDAWFTVDIRSNDPEVFAELESKVVEIGRRTARELGVEFDLETMHRMAGASIRGSERSTLVRAAQSVLRHLGWERIHLTPRGTADHNVAIARGIPGIALGVTTGDGAHTPHEYADVGPYSTGVKQLLLLILIPLT